MNFWCPLLILAAPLQLYSDRRRLPGGNNGGSTGTTAASGDCNVDVGDDASYTETIEADSSAWNGYIRNVQSSGCPNYPTSVVKYDYTAAIQNPEFDIPAYPCFADETYSVTCDTSAIGVMMNGVRFFSMMRGGCNVCDSSCDAVDDEHEDFNECGGHPSDFGTYHYHMLPSCLLDQMDDYYNVDSHSPQIGWALDGFPIYGPHTVNGSDIYLCTDSNADSEHCLDECGGTEQYEIDGFKYHYHVQGPMTDLETVPAYPYPSTDYQPYTVGCFKGVPISSTFSTGGSCSSNGTTSDYTPAATEGVTDVYTSTSTPTSTNSDAPTSSSGTPTPVMSTTPISTQTVTNVTLTVSTTMNATQITVDEADSAYCLSQDAVSILLWTLVIVAYN